MLKKTAGAAKRDRGTAKTANDASALAEAIGSAGRLTRAPGLKISDLGLGSLDLGVRMADLLPQQPLALNIGGLIGSGLTNQLTEQWRDQLLEGQQFAGLQVARSISNIVADDSLTAIQNTIRGIGADLLSQGLQAELRKTSESLQVTIGGLLRESIIESLQPAALLATEAWAERARAASERQRAYDEALREMGWLMPPSADMDFFWEVGRLAYEGKRLAVRREMTAAARSRDFGRVVNGWMELEPFRRRRSILRDALQDHRRRRYRVSIPVLLPQIEGIAIDAFDPGSKDTSPTRAVRSAALDQLLGPALVEAITALWKHQHFDQVGPDDRQLNRQLILHGRSVGYAREIHSARLLFTLDLLAWLVERSEQHNSP